MKIRTVRSEPPFTDIRSILRAEESDDPGFRDQVASIVRSVVERGDAAVVEFSGTFDRFPVSSVEELRISADEMEAAARKIDQDLLEGLRRAAENVRIFHEKQLERGFLDFLPDGTVMGQRVLPLARVGLYVPGGQAAYPSSVLMNAIPARVAGVDRVVMMSPTPGGAVTPAVLAAAHLCGIHEMYRIGGAHAVAAMAYGTESIEPVDKIVGPGSRWVAEAKRQVYGRVDIDLIAGPSEILVVADSEANPRHVAADLIGQAEHDADAIAWLVTDYPPLAEAVMGELADLLANHPRREIAIKSLQENGLIVIVEDLQAAAAVADLRAPEHLELIVRDPLGLAGRIRNAGAIFLGASTPEPLGDYFAGPNHVLPTGGTARWASPLGTYDFVKRTGILGYSRERMLAHAEDVIRLAESEGLRGHADTLRVRLES